MLLPKITCLLFLCSILRNKWVIKLIFLHADKHESFLQIDSMLLMGLINLPKIPKIASLQCLYDISKKVKGKVGFLHSDKHQSSYKAILSLLMGMNRHSQSTQNNKFSMSLQYPKKTLGMKIISIAISFLFYCDAKHSDILPGSSWSSFLAAVSRMSSLWLILISICINFLGRYTITLSSCFPFLANIVFTLFSKFGLPKF